MSSSVFTKAATAPVLTMNGGSSSIRRALFGEGNTAEPSLHGKANRIDLSGINLTFQEGEGLRRRPHLATGHPIPTAADSVPLLAPNEKHIKGDCDHGTQLE